MQYSVGTRQRVAQMVEADRARIDKPGKARAKVFTVRQADASAMLPKNVRRIAIPAAQRGASLPKVASQADIQTALKAYVGRTDGASVAIARALSALLTSPQSKP